MAQRRQKDASKGWSVFWREDAGKQRAVLAYQRDDGSWAQHRIPDNITTQRNAERYAQTWLAEQRAAGRLGPRTIEGRSHSVKALAQRWFVLREGNDKVRASTVKDNRSHFKQHIEPTIGELPIDSLTVPRLRAWIRELRGRVAGATTVRNIASTLSAFLADAIAEGWTGLRDNPMTTTAVRCELPTIPKPSGADDDDGVAHLPLEHMRSLVNHDAVPAARVVRYLLGCLAGLRDGEIAGGKWGDIDLDATIPVWPVKRACVMKGRKGYAELGEPKTQTSKRKVPLHDTAAAGLRWWRAVGWCVETGKDEPSDDDPIFPSPVHGGHYRPRSAEFLRDDLESAGLPTTAPDGSPFEFRNLRASFSTWLYAAGVSEETRGKLMGHSPKSVTADRYTDAVIGRLHEAVMRVELRCARCAGYCADRTRDERKETTAAGLRRHVRGVVMRRAQGKSKALRRALTSRAGVVVSG